MNFCTKCASYYARPGTCNCYAFVPVYPTCPTTYPIFPPPVTPSRPWADDNTARPMPPGITITSGNTMEIKTDAAPDGGGPDGRTEHPPSKE